MNTKLIECPECEGHGSYFDQGQAVPHRGGFKRPTIVVRCDACNGSGKASKLAAEQLTQAEFTQAQDKLDSMLRATKRGTAERDAVDAIVAVWERVNALPERTAAEREFRLAAIAQVATAHDLVTL